MRYLAGSLSVWMALTVIPLRSQEMLNLIVVEGEGAIKQAPSKGQDAARIAILAGTGAAIGGIADRSWKGAGIGAAAGGAVGFAVTLLTRGHEVELRAGSTLDVVFDRPVGID